ncbi:hypothetical protein AKO1_014083 [Acrasis kona]|uniref:RGS domain-containing protein n=1 Tax=Acrasis kona TaxID=1008807 RepID=A0AAW2Z3I1_9EUKA
MQWNTTNTTEPTPIPSIGPITDQEYVSPISWALVGVISCSNIFLLIFIFIRRRQQPVKAFGPLLTSSLIFYEMIATIVFLTRLGVKRTPFPCFLYTFSFLVLMPGFVLVKAARCLRLILLYHLSNYKAYGTSNKVDDVQNPTKWNNDNIDYQIFKRNTRVMNFLSSKYFILTLTLFMIMIQILLWLVVTGIYSLYKPERFLYTASFCAMDTILASMTAVFCGVYIVVQLILTVYIFFRVQDSWGLAKESIFMSFVYIFWLIALTVLNAVPAYYLLAEYYFPAVWVLLPVFFSDSMTAFIVCIRSLLKRNNFLMHNKDEDIDEMSTTQYVEPTTNPSRMPTRGASLVMTNRSKIDVILEDSSARSEFLDYCVQSFCPESVRAWIDIQSYKHNEVMKHRIKNAILIYDYYLDQKNAIMLLNLPNFKKFNAPIERAINVVKSIDVNQIELVSSPVTTSDGCMSPNSESLLLSPTLTESIGSPSEAQSREAVTEDTIRELFHVNLFEKIEMHVKTDMVDTYIRFKKTNSFKVLVQRLPQLGIEDDM